MMGEASSPAVQLVKSWLKARLTGCTFAKMLLADEGIWVQDRVYRRENPFEFLDDMLFEVGAERQVALVIFPDIMSVAEVVEWLLALSGEERWRVSKIAEEEGRTYLRVEWLTEEGKWSNCMGLAPLISMPPTRRAPYVGLVLWPGAQSRSGGDEVNFMDIPHPQELQADPKARRNLLNQVRDTTRVLLAQQPRRDWRDVSFCLDSAYCYAFGDDVV